MSDLLTRLDMHKILVVDDELVFQKLIKKQLEKNNFEVFPCLQSENAIKMIEVNSPNLVLMDLMMPVIDGISLIKQIRQLILHTYLPIVVVTAKNEPRDLIEAMDAGADDYISKPFEFEELYARIKNMLRLKGLQDSILLKTQELDKANQQISFLNQNLTDTNRQLKKKVYDMRNIFEISRQVMRNTEPEWLVSEVLIHALGVFSAKSSLILLLEPDHQEYFTVRESKGFLTDKVKDFVIAREDRLVRYLEFIKKPLQIREMLYEFENIMSDLRELEIRVIAPLFQEEQLTGVLCLGPNVTDQEYSPDVLDILEIMANMLSVALQNAQNFEQIKALSYIDAMTGLHNYRFFSMRLKEEIARSKRNHSTLALLIMDVDFFKNYNDALGHPAGDDVLRQLSTIMKSTVRDNDIVARYGGEEFAVILPATELKGAHALAERIREKVEMHVFQKEEIQPSGNLTISVGIAVYPDHALTVEDIIIAADRALYFAKQTGRNRVVCFNEIKS